MSDSEAIEWLEGHHDNLATLHQRATRELLPPLSQSSPQAVDTAAGFLDDRLSLYRFFKRSKFDFDKALSALSLCLQWRLAQSIDMLSPLDMDPLYVHQPLLFFHPELKDKSGRPCAVLNLKHVQRSDDGSLDGLKKFIAWSWELARRYMLDINSQPLHNLFENGPSSSSGPLHLQMVLIVDLKDASLNNLEIELFPYFVDLLRTNYPGMVGAIFILNYGWMYAGMWQLAKRILPQVVLDRIVFANNEKDLLKHFDPPNLLLEHGGDLDYEYNFLTNPIIARYSHATPPTLEQAVFGRETALSRISSASSFRDIFFSAPTTPGSSSTLLYTDPPPGYIYASSPHHPRPSWLSMTAFNTGQHTPVSSGPHRRQNSLSVSKFGEAVRHNLAKQNSRRGNGCELYLPGNEAIEKVSEGECSSSEDEEDKYTVKDDGVACSDQAGLEDCEEDGKLSILISLPPSSWKDGHLKNVVKEWHVRLGSSSATSCVVDGNRLDAPDEPVASRSRKDNEKAIDYNYANTNTTSRSNQAFRVAGGGDGVFGNRKRKRDMIWSIVIWLTRFRMARIDLRLVIFLLVLCYRSRNKILQNQFRFRVALG